MSVPVQYKNQTAIIVPIVCGLSSHCNMLCCGLFGVMPTTKWQLLYVHVHVGGECLSRGVGS